MIRGPVTGTTFHLKTMDPPIDRPTPMQEMQQKGMLSFQELQGPRMSRIKGGWPVRGSWFFMLACFGEGNLSGKSKIDEP